MTLVKTMFVKNNKVTKFSFCYIVLSLLLFSLPPIHFSLVFSVSRSWFPGKLRALMVSTLLKQVSWKVEGEVKFISYRWIPYGRRVLRVCYRCLLSDGNTSRFPVVIRPRSSSGSSMTRGSWCKGSKDKRFSRLGPKGKWWCFIKISTLSRKWIVSVDNRYDTATDLGGELSATERSSGPIADTKGSLADVWDSNEIGTGSIRRSVDPDSGTETMQVSDGFDGFSKCGSTAFGSKG